MNTNIPTNEVQLELDRLRAENEALRANQARKTPQMIKVGEKGGVVVSGLSSWPVTLYQEQWVALLEKKDEILAFISANQDKLKRRDPNHKSARQIAKEQGVSFKQFVANGK